MKHIPLRQLRDMFRGMQQEAGWDVTGDLLWGFFFVDSDLERLGRLAKSLVDEEYAFVDIRATDVEEYQLHVERVETHSPESLDRRNAELEQVAANMGVKRYDGMDAGPVPSADA